MPSSSANRITVIAFDLGNVLVKVDHLRFCRAVGELAGRSPEQVFADVFETTLEPGFDTGRIGPEEFHRLIIEHYGIDLEYPRFCRYWNDIFDPMEGMEEMVAHLKARYPLFLLSNTNSLHFPYIRENFPVCRHFRHFILSYEVGSRKPEAGIFQYLIRRAGRPAAEILFVDDKPPFVAAARSQGLISWAFTSPEEMVRDLERHGLW